MFRSQDAKIESRPSFLGKAYPVKMYSFYVLRCVFLVISHQLSNDRFASFLFFIRRASRSWRVETEISNMYEKTYVIDGVHFSFDQIGKELCVI